MAEFATIKMALRKNFSFKKNRFRLYQYNSLFALNIRVIHLQDGRLAPFVVLRKIHHSFRHVLTVEQGLIERHIGLQYPVGQYVIQPRIGALPEGDPHKRPDH
ncbi:hypothetical protein Xszus_04172 [Xenorhabdus szentirmaii]|nr:hypothetical protein Xsze_01992 [Xenorhabdus szentirmaii DSM 16338]PHM44342.1 hypothetical protein Xszus_04172 [Xenorhabdus szentirmaii]